MRGRKKVFARAAAAGLAAVLLITNSNFQAFATLGETTKDITQEEEDEAATPSEAVKAASPSEAAEAEDLKQEAGKSNLEVAEEIASTPSEALAASVKESVTGSWSLITGEGVLKDSQGNTVVKLEKNTGTFTNGESQVLKVDASGGKFAVQDIRTQINAGTEILIPVTGDVCILQITAHKNWDGGISLSDISQVLAGAESAVTVSGVKSCNAEGAEESGSDYRIYTYRCVLEKPAEEMSVRFNAAGGNSKYVTNIETECFNAETVKLSGKLTIENGSSPKSVKTVLMNERTKEKFTETVNFYDGEGEYEAELPVYGETENYQLYLDNEYFAISGPSQIEISSGSDSPGCDFIVVSSLKYTVLINFSEDIDLTGVEYSYKNTETNQVYTFKTDEKIELTDGSYVFGFTGETDRLACEITDGENIKINGGSITQTVTLKPLTEWIFYADGSEDYYQKSIEGDSGYFRGAFINAQSGKLVPNGAAASANSSQFTTGAVIRIPVTGKCTMSVEAYDAPYALYTVDTISVQNQNPYVYQYEGEAGFIDIVSTGGAYLKSVTLVYPPKEVNYKEQEEMPFTADFGTGTNLTVAPEGQRLNITQTGGSMTSTGLSTVSYYVFPKTSEWQTLSADVVLRSGLSSTSSGIFFGAFDENYLSTIGIRSKTGIRGILSKSSTELVGASGPNQTIEEGEKVTFSACKTESGLLITYKPKSGEESSYTFKYNDSKNLLFKDKGIDTECYYGFAFASGTFEITNMKLHDETGKLLYDQNDCYEPEGTAPVADNVTAEADSSREFIRVAWTGETCSGDEKYVLQVSRDGENWEDVSDDLTENSYNYPITGGGSWYFRVCGTVGNEPAIEDRNEWVTIKSPVILTAALTAPAVTATAFENSIELSWTGVDTALRYEVYRYSYDETQSGAKLISTTENLEYTDQNITQQMPYYYYVKAFSQTNESNGSEVVWAVATGERNGNYVYEEEEIPVTITKKSYDTSYQKDVVIEGISQEACTLKALVNGSAQETGEEITAGGSFSLNLVMKEGRNDVNLLFTDSQGAVTRKTFNFVYLTNYDMVVNSSYTGTDGDLVNGIPVYKTVQAAVDAVNSNSTKRNVILVKEGAYREHLIINKPYISLVGEDRDMVNIHFYDKSESPEGGDMKTRCAVYVTSDAKGFTAENLTFQNDYQYLGTGSNESADALRNDAEGAVYINTAMIGYQDTLCANLGKQYYYKCRITGNVDFIYGNDPRALFRDCDLIFRYNSTKNSGYLSAPKTSADAKYGLTFYDCRILSEEGCSGSKYRLGRPWGADGYLTFINTYMGQIVNKEESYDDMSGNSFMKARFFEYGSYGPGFAINEKRRQISPSRADEMLSTSLLGWEPEKEVKTRSSDYQGEVFTNELPKFVTAEYSPDTYNEKEGDDTGLGAYQLEGYAQAGNVTGGGLLKETSENYYTVSDAASFLNALISVKQSGKKSVIEITGDIGLGSNEVENFSSYSSVIKAYSAQPLTHPVLKETGVSVLMLKSMSNLTIFSGNGAAILHANVDISDSSNIIIRNLVFDELWEWDEDTAGEYDRNDWDYMTIESESTNVWVDHCTFYKAYDGVVDVKNPSTSKTSNITISWCSFLPASRGDFFEIMMDELAADSHKYPYYTHLIQDLHMTKEQVFSYAYGQKKTHLFGQSDDAVNAANIRVTLANNYYSDSMDRMPRMRYGYAHVYNCVLDAKDLYQAKLSIENSEAAEKIVSNGASSTCRGKVLLENCYINDIMNPLNSGNGASPSGYINAVNSVYYLNGVKTNLQPKSNSTTDSTILVLNAEEFKDSLPYKEPVRYPAEQLNDLVIPYSGAGVINMTVLQWEKTVYYDSQNTNPGENGNDPGENEEPDPEGSTEPEPGYTNYSEEDDEQEYYEIKKDKKEADKRRNNAVEVKEADAGTWLKTEEGTWSLVKKEGTLAAREWGFVNGIWYYFDQNGYMTTGWLKTPDGKWYYLHPSYGGMATGWILTDEKWYYLNPEKGDCLIDTVTPDGYQVDHSGAWTGR